jgi:uncharacterized protein
MNILIAGASGLIGKTLTNSLSQKHQITVLGRQLEKLEKTFPDHIQKLTWDDLTHHDANHYALIINLCGLNIGDKRWSESVKKELIESRTSTNLKLTEWLIHYNAKPRFFCANAIGIYGAEALSTSSFDETTPLPSSPHDFLQQISFAWEQSLQKAIDYSIPVTTLRFGVVLKKGEGMLKKLELPFWLGLGSVLGSGNQTLSWIYHKDLAKAVNFLIENPTTGPVNITSPSPVTQKEFAQQFATALGRKLFFPTPAWFIKLVFGEMGEELLLKGQKVVPTRLTDLGFTFDYSDIGSALAADFPKRI